MGAVGGTLWHGIKGARNSPKGDKLLGSLSAIKARAPVVGGNFGVWGGLFSSFDCAVKGYRQKEDPYNALISGFLTGGTLAVRSKSGRARGIDGDGVRVQAVADRVAFGLQVDPRACSARPSGARSCSVSFQRSNVVVMVDKLTVCGACCRRVRGSRSPRRPPVRRKQQANLAHPSRGEHPINLLPPPFNRLVPLSPGLTRPGSVSSLSPHSSRPRHRPRPSSCRLKPPSFHIVFLSSMLPLYPPPPSTPPFSSCVQHFLSSHTSPHSGLVWLYTLFPTTFRSVRRGGRVGGGGCVRQERRVRVRLSPGPRLA